MNAHSTSNDAARTTAARDTHGPSPSAAWFAQGEHVGYDPRARAIVAGSEPPLEVFLSREGELAHAVSFLPGFPDGSFGWAKVRPRLPSAREMPKLFLDYVGMGDSDKPKDYAYSTAERTDLVEAIWRDLSGGPARVTEIAAPFDMSLNAVSKHLKVLEEAGLVAREKVGRDHILTFRGAPLRGVSVWVHEYERFWSERLDRFEGFFKEKRRRS